jgi:hypothetical protein
MAEHLPTVAGAGRANDAFRLELAEERFSGLAVDAEPAVDHEGGDVCMHLGQPTNVL